MKFVAALLVAAAQVQAFPSVLKRDYAQPGCTTSKLCDTVLPVSYEEAGIPSQPNAFTQISKARTNCGILGVCNIFNAEEQYVSTTGNNAWQSPSASDIRGPCPGLNAAANHNYLPRNGLVDIPQTIYGMSAAYGMTRDLAAFLAVYSISFDGDVLTQTWSIGGPLPANVATGLIGDPQGNSYSHNNYEGDTSITRCDAYINGGDAHSSSPTRFNYAWAAGMDDDSYTLDKFSILYAQNTVRSVKQNPLYFAPLFSTTIVSPAAYNFVINFMSNHTAEQPGGYLDGYNFKTFFGYSGEYNNWTWLKGQERIPDNWYKRPLENPYGALSILADNQAEYQAYPQTFRFGGNTHGTDTYAGIDITNLTGGAYNFDTLFEGDNFACFFTENEQQAIPLQLQGGVNDVGAAVDLITKYFPPALKALSCPQISKYDSGLTTKYTGYNYKPSAPLAGGPMNC